MTSRYYHFPAGFQRRLLTSLLPLVFGFLSKAIQSSDISSQKPLNSFEIYNNYFAFLLLMIFLEIIFIIVQQAITSRKTSNFEAESNKDAIINCFTNIREQKGDFNKIIKALFIAIASYTAIFLSYQVIIGLFSLSLVQNRINLNDSLPVNMNMEMENSSIERESTDLAEVNLNDIDVSIRIPRILVEEEEKLLENNILMNQKLSSSSPSQMADERITLSMSKIKSVLDLEVGAMVLSRDQKLAFVIVRSGSYSRTLKVIDISDLKSPKVVGSDQFWRKLYTKSDIYALAFSSDEKTLFISNFMELNIYDISDPSSPKEISFTETNVLYAKYLWDFERKFRASLAIDESTKTLFIGGLGLLVYDLSNLKEPKLLKAIVDDSYWYGGQKGIFYANEIKLSSSSGEKVLFLANNTLDIYNISNPRKGIELISSTPTPSSAGSLQFTRDPNRILLLGTSYEEGVKIDEVDVSSYSSPIIQRSYQLGYQTTKVAHFLAVSPGQTRYVLYTDTSNEKDSSPTGLLIFNDKTKTMIKYSETLIQDAYALEFSKDGKNVITISNDQFLVVELLQDFPNTEIFGFEANKIGHVSYPGAVCKQMKLSPDGKTMFLVSPMDSDMLHLSQFWNVTDADAPNVLSDFHVRADFVEVIFPEHFQTAYVVFREEIFIMNISDLSDPTLMGQKTNENPEWDLHHLVITSDEQTGIALMDRQGSVIVAFNLSYSESTEIQAFWTLNELCSSSNCRILLKDDRTLLVIEKNITIYDISSIKSPPIQIASLPLVLNDTKTTPDINSVQLSPDRKTLYVQVYELGDSGLHRLGGLYRLQTYNITVLTSPCLIKEHSFYRTGKFPTNRDFITFASDFKTGFILQGSSVFKIKLPTNMHEEIKIIAQIPLLVEQGDKTEEFIPYPDGQVIYAKAADKRKINIISTHPQHTLYLKQEKFLLGEKYSDQVAIFKRIGAFDYQGLDQKSYKILKLSLLDIKAAHQKTAPESTESSLPSWIGFDFENNILTLEPKTRNNLGAYTLQSIVSFRIPDNAFDGLSGISSEDLIAWLIALDYLDNQLYLTASFGTIESSSSSNNLKSFYLPSEFKTFKQQIYNILKKFYFKTCTVIEIVSSLDFDHPVTGVSTPSPDHIQVDINLIPSSESESKALFLHKSYPSLSSFITNKKSRLHLEGALEDINTALQSIVVNFDHNDTECHANFTIQDGLNKPLTVPFEMASNLFIANTPPELHKSVQDQINMVDISTGQNFIVEFDEDTFKTNYTDDPLTYELAMIQNNTQPPKWLTLNGLKLRGIPPEEILQDIELILIAKNEFKELREPFKLRVKISLAFSLKLFLKYASYMISVVGLMVSLTKIWNIVGQKFYKHPKEYVLNSGEKVTSETIAPIFFVGKEKQESKLIMKHLEKYILKNLQLKSVTRSQLVNHFIDSTSKELDKQKIFDIIQEIINNLAIKEKTKLECYCSAKKSRKVFIEQLIIDQMTLWQLDQDLENKLTFEKLKDKWAEFIYWDPSLSKFVLNQDKFDQLLKDHKSLPSETESLLDRSTNDSSLLISEGNFNLLQDSLLAYVSGVHQINESPLQVDVSMKEQVKSNLLFKLLKIDLLSTHKINYGINYDITDDILNFSGTVKDYLQGKTLVVQIATIKNRILKEIRIHGAPESSTKHQEITDHLLNENSYEVF